jgi:hypothetical protein
MQEITLPNPLYPELSKRINTPFVQHLISGETMNVNTRPMLMALWNLAVSERDLKMFVKINMKPHRNWKITDTKKYFGITGCGEKLLNDFLALKAEIKKIQGE